jgi:GTP cyclohydrolase II
MSLSQEQAPGANLETAPEATLTAVARAVDALRAGAILRISDSSRSIAAVAIETATTGAIRDLERGAELYLVLTPERARTLKIRIYTADAVALPFAAPLDAERLRAVADPTFDLSEPLKGPFSPVRENLPPAWAAAVKLTKLAGLLPAVLVGPADLSPQARAAIALCDVLAYDSAVVASLKLVARARVPLEAAERTEVVAFRAGTGEPEHIAIVIGDPPRDKPVLARLHSECFTGDLLGSLRCDCGVQLREAIAAIAKAGGGVLLYLAQEGRGIGLINKLRAYRLQDQGFDTIEANERLGFEGDERLYGIAARMLTLLGFKSVRLMTNNPKKVEALKAAGIPVVERVPHAFPATAHNRDYLRTKAEKSGHLL